MTEEDEYFNQIEQTLGVDWGTEDKCAVTLMEVKDGKVRVIETADYDDTRGVSSTGRAPALQAGGQGFKSPTLHERNKMAKIVIGKTPGFRWSDILVWAGVDLILFVFITIATVIALKNGSHIKVGIGIGAMVTIAFLTFVRFRDAYQIARSLP